MPACRAIQTGCGCHLHTELLSVGQGRAASQAASQGQHGPAAPPEVSPGDAEAPCAGWGRWRALCSPGGTTG